MKTNFRLAASSFLAAALLAAPSSQARAKSIVQARNEILVQTMPYLNVPYLWGGVYPQTGLDCSAFVQLVYHRVGLALPRVAKSQFVATRYVRPNQVLPGDLLFFSMHHPGSHKADMVDHVGIFLGKYFGKGKYYGKPVFIHASVTNGIHIEPLINPYYLKRLISIRRYAGF